MNLFSLKIKGWSAIYAAHSFYASNSNKKLNPLLISGTTRGGTTWLMELLYQKNMQVIWEPTKYETLSLYNKEFTEALGAIPYIPESAVWEDAYFYFQKLLNGNVPQRILKDAHPLLLSNPLYKNRAIIKCCNITPLIPWICKNFDVQPIVLVRNPMSVIASQLNHKGYQGIGTKINLFKLNNSKYNDLFEKYGRPISAINSKVSMLANWWAIQQVEVLNKNTVVDKNKWILLSYKELVLNTSAELQKLFTIYGIEKTIIDNEYNSPSATAVNQFKHSEEYLTHWKKSLKLNEIKEIELVLEAYGLEQYIEF